MTSVLLRTGDTEIVLVLVLDTALLPLTGLTDVLLSLRRTSDGRYYDFSDDTFKTAGWTTRRTAMSEVDAANSPGEYSYSFDTGAVTNPVADDTYQLRVEQSPGTSAKNLPQMGEIRVGQLADVLYDVLADTAAVDARLPTDPADQSEVEAAVAAGTLAVRGSDGDDLKTISEQLDAVPTVVQVVDGVWDEAVADHQTVGSTGEVVLRQEVRLGVSYDTDADTSYVEVWLEVNGKTVVSGVSNAVASFYSVDDTVQFVVTDTTPDDQGVFRMERIAPGFVQDRLYNVVCSVDTTTETITTTKVVEIIS